MCSYEACPQIRIVGSKRQIDYESVIISMEIKARVGVPIEFIYLGLENLVTVS